MQDTDVTYTDVTYTDVTHTDALIHIFMHADLYVQSKMLCAVKSIWQEFYRYDSCIRSIRLIFSPSYDDLDDLPLIMGDPELDGISIGIQYGPILVEINECLSLKRQLICESGILRYSTTGSDQQINVEVKINGIMMNTYVQNFLEYYYLPFFSLQN
jgi:hypothetical protein